MMNSFEIDLGGIVNDICYDSNSKCLDVTTCRDIEVLPCDAISAIDWSPIEIETIYVDGSSVDQIAGLLSSDFSNVKNLTLTGFSEDAPFPFNDYVHIFKSLQHVNFGRYVSLDFAKISINYNLKSIALKISDCQKNFSDMANIKELSLLSLEFDEKSPKIKLNDSLNVKELSLLFEKKSKVQYDILSFFYNVEKLWLGGFKEIPDLSEFENLRHVVVEGSPALKKMDPPNNDVKIHTVAYAGMFD